MEVARQAEELRALQAVQIAAWDLGRARRYSWPADRKAILAETLASSRGRPAAVNNGVPRTASRLDRCHTMAQPPRG